MSKSLASYPEHERAEVIKRRLAQKDQGLGYWAAVDAQRAIEQKRRESRENKG